MAGSGAVGHRQFFLLKGPTQDALYNLHKSLGVVILVLMVLRLINRLAAGALTPRFTWPCLEVAHRDLKISPAEFDEIAAELGRSLDFAKVPKREKDEVVAAFAAHKSEVTAGYIAAAKRR
jgi:hypothetical protein